MRILAIDTCDARGSVAFRSGMTESLIILHNGQADYSTWLLPAVASLGKALNLPQSADVLAVCSGPGSFTGLRVGLTTVKAWAEVYSKPIAAISRLEAMANRASADGYIAACYDAQRGHIFGGIYRRRAGRLELLDQEMVVSPESFLDVVHSAVGKEKVSWISLDADLITSQSGWQQRIRVGDSLSRCVPDLAGTIAELAEHRAQNRTFTDALALDANYVRRSDAEIFWKAR